ncbi:ComF family protein [Acinetobacter sp. WCHAc010034]|uniref:ComF family protein n=1 Tax=Acinetobacter sp. WCHAc010034 TaxID=1879049 RepID=UPI000839F326|nr:phosphoribosyltransferase family protein [Acinetobacter sp. WCHAc010034]AYA03613.1 ComF family protein [Acinetobacter sp. WCHAc010034]
MPMFSRILQQAKGLIQSLQPCQLCHADTQHRHNVCADCWNSLPWLKSPVLRQEMQVLAACQYAYPLDRIIQQFKYEQQLQYRPLLSGLLKNLRYPKVHAIVPMPVSLERLNQRGYNQSLLLAKDLAQHLQLPVWQPVQRLKQHAQKGLSRLERLEGIQQQFIIAAQPKAHYRKVLIVDDVVTTGSSLHALKQSLEQLGCRQIHAVCLAAAE